MTQMQVANALGVTNAAVSQWEAGKTMPKGASLLNLSKIFGCTVDELLEEEE